MNENMSNIMTFGFTDVGKSVYRGRIHSDHLQFVQQDLTEMGLTCAYSKANFEIWSSEDDKEVVLINHAVEPSSNWSEDQS